MISYEILRQYLVGAMRSSTAIHELESNLLDTSSPEKIQEGARCRYVIGFIRRVVQFKCDEASKKDLCLNIRDLILIMGRTKLTDRLYEVVKECGSEFGLICEPDNTVSCMLNTPAWLSNNSYIKDVYALKYDKDSDGEVSSAGDKMLTEHTIFTTYKSFEQKIAVYTALLLPQGDTLLISQPTGGGKSLITQLLSSTSSGLTVVIVPTVALAMDQYLSAQHNLKLSEGLFCYQGDQTESERDTILAHLKSRSARILFTSPEAILKNPVLYNILEHAAEQRYLTNIVIDEAHIVPDWGTFFRPDFQVFSIVLKKWRKLSSNYIRTFLLSATLSEDVVSTLFSLFGSECGNFQVRCDTLRQEPRFYFHSVKSLKEQDDKTLEAIKLLPKPMVIYVLEPREAIELQKKLRASGYQNIPVFTGETKDSERQKLLIQWKQHKFDVVLATSAFGIGVDKPDVRTIVHACCPENLSRFYQEVGRGGRDHLPSISLFMPYQSNRDSAGDVRRALGLVNKRVLTVDVAVSRWMSMLRSPTAIVDGDQCVLDTSTPPSYMTDEEAEYTGNRNVAWNINLLLMLYRTGFIDLLDAQYIYNTADYPPKKYYAITTKLIAVDVLSDPDALHEALTEPRAHEYDMQMSGYKIISSLVSSPKSTCWGRVFKHLFPLSNEVCSGCPVDPTGRITTDTKYKLRLDPGIKLPPSQPNRRLRRNIGSYSYLIVRRSISGAYTQDELQSICTRAAANEIGAFVLPPHFIDDLCVPGIALNYDEFYFAVKHCPYLFYRGVLCVFDEDSERNLALFKNLERLNTFGYKKILYCNENSIISHTGKPVKECIDGYTIQPEKL